MTKKIKKEIIASEPVESVDQAFTKSEITRLVDNQKSLVEKMKNEKIKKEIIASEPVESVKVENIQIFTKSEITRLVDNQKSLIVVTVGNENRPANFHDLEQVTVKIDALCKELHDVRVLVVPHLITVKVYKNE